MKPSHSLLPLSGFGRLLDSVRGESLPVRNRIQFCTFHPARAGGKKTGEQVGTCNRRNLVDLFHAGKDRHMQQAPISNFSIFRRRKMPSKTRTRFTCFPFDCIFQTSFVVFELRNTALNGSQARLRPSLHSGNVCDASELAQFTVADGEHILLADTSPTVTFMTFLTCDVWAFISGNYRGRSPWGRKARPFFLVLPF